MLRASLALNPNANAHLLGSDSLWPINLEASKTDELTHADTPPLLQHIYIQYLS